MRSADPSGRTAAPARRPPPAPPALPRVPRPNGFEPIRRPRAHEPVRASSPGRKRPAPARARPRAGALDHQTSRTILTVRGPRHAWRLVQALWLIIGLVAGGAGVALLLWPRLVRAQADLRHERDQGEERLAALRDAQQQMSASFKALSSEALQANMAQLTELARAQLRTTQAEAQGDLDQRRQAVEQLVAPLRDQLGRVDAQLLKLDQDRRESRGRLEAQLRTLTETGEKLRTETGALVTALRKPNTRGQWGQMQLRNVVELAGMVRHCDFVEQVSLSGEEALRPDAIVRMPGGKHVMIDAKAPLQGVLDAYEARGEEERQRRLRDHARLLRKHFRALAAKAYW